MSSLTILRNLLMIFLITNVYSDKRYKGEDGLIVLIGPTRAGKSCFINTITGENFAEVGDDSGDSTTKVAKEFESEIIGFDNEQIFSIVDTKGLDDTEDSEFSNPIILADTILMLRQITKKKAINLDAILLFESLTNDSNKLNNNIKKLKAAYGEEILESIIVILNKKPNPHPKRLQKLITTIESHNVKYLLWKSGCNQDFTENQRKEYNNQMHQLNNLFMNITTLEKSNIENITENLVKEGRKIFKISSELVLIQKLQKFIALGSAGLIALQILNLPSVIITNLATYALHEIIAQLENNEKYLISLAIEEKLKEAFKNKKNKVVDL